MRIPEGNGHKVSNALLSKNGGSGPGESSGFAKKGMQVWGPSGTARTVEVGQFFSAFLHSSPSFPK